jgi:hypothetical protein
MGYFLTPKYIHPNVMGLIEFEPGIIDSTSNPNAMVMPVRNLDLDISVSDTTLS